MYNIHPLAHVCRTKALCRLLLSFTPLLQGCGVVKLQLVHVHSRLCLNRLIFLHTNRELSSHITKRALVNAL